jgi:hypothetical protein
MEAIQKETIVAIIFLIIGMTFIFLSLRGIMKSKESINWSTTEGEILKSKTTSSTDFERGTKTFNVSIEYKYKVKDKEYKSSRVYFGSEISMTGKEEKSKMLAKKYLDNRYVRVYYKPENEKISVLETGIHSELYWGLGIGIILIISTVVYLII